VYPLCAKPRRRTANLIRWPTKTRFKSSSHVQVSTPAKGLHQVTPLVNVALIIRLQYAQRFDRMLFRIPASVAHAWEEPHVSWETSCCCTATGSAFDVIIVADGPSSFYTNLICVERLFELILNRIQYCSYMSRKAFCLHSSACRSANDARHHRKLVSQLDYLRWNVSEWLPSCTTSCGTQFADRT